MLLLITIGGLTLIGRLLLRAVLAIRSLARQSRLGPRMHNHTQWVAIRLIYGTLTRLSAVPRIVLPLGDHGVVL